MREEGGVCEESAHGAAELGDEEVRAVEQLEAVAELDDAGDVQNLGGREA